jgi:hypothetical protein
MAWLVTIGRRDETGRRVDGGDGHDPDHTSRVILVTAFHRAIFYPDERAL